MYRAKKYINHEDIARIKLFIFTIFIFFVFYPSVAQEISIEKTKTHAVRVTAYDNKYRVYTPIKLEKSHIIIVLHGSEGGASGWSHLFAYRLATMGFIAIPFPYSIGGNIWHAGDIKGVQLKDTIDFIGRVKSFKSSSGKVAIYGASRGAEHALLLGAYSVKYKSDVIPDAIAVHASTDTVVGSFFSENTFDKFDRQKTLCSAAVNRENPSCVAWCWGDQPIRQGSVIEINLYGRPIFISHGLKDNLWKAERTRNLEKILKEANRNITVHYYDNDGHSLSVESMELQLDRLRGFFENALD